MWSANNTWTSTVATQAPVSLHVQGRVGGAHAHDFDHVYSFSEYRPNFEDVNHVSNAFEVCVCACVRACVRACAPERASACV